FKMHNGFHYIFCIYILHFNLRLSEALFRIIADKNSISIFFSTSELLKFVCNKKTWIIII
ncbi:hypothetical protein CMT91_17020, partial [Elizabethkingia anophelis]|nr:hypothetical protein [Elizabethkingia anophelis]